jgi:ABC-type transport system involved in multi-copper enzyme maturation permease subunit
MSPEELVIPMPAKVASYPWALWRAQLLTILRLELKRNFFKLRGFWIYILAFAPAVIIGAHAMTSSGRCTLEEDTTILAGIFQLFYLRLGIFFGCMGIFTRLFRGEVMEKSLHYYFLAPVRRELLVLGKFLAGVIAAIFFFSSGVLLSFIFMNGHFGETGRQYVFSGPGLEQLGWYLLVTVLACIGYGSLFLLMGLLFRNPVVPAVSILLWESINNVLPAMLKKLSIVFYLLPLCPVEVPAEGIGALFTVVADPVPIYLAIPGLICVSGLSLYYAARKIRSMEISYGSD